MVTAPVMGDKVTKVIALLVAFLAKMTGPVLSTFGLPRLAPLLQTAPVLLESVHARSNV